ncbi:MAG: hypothetical protein JXA94_01660, partial [Parachlamydiales bacterium]|nr:hypothetical protein [Parachlamydiales bacterium]
EAIFLRNVDTRLRECPTFYENLPDFVGPLIEDNPHLEFDIRKVLTYLQKEGNVVARQTFLKLLAEEKYEEAGKLSQISLDKIGLSRVPMYNGLLVILDHYRKLENVFDNCPDLYRRIYGYLWLVKKLHSILVDQFHGGADQLLLRNELERLKNKTEELIENQVKETLPERDFLKKDKLVFLIFINICLAQVYNTNGFLNNEKAQSHFNKVFEMISKIEDQDLKKKFLFDLTTIYYNFLYDRKSPEEAQKYLSQLIRYCLSRLRIIDEQQEMIDLRILKLNLDEQTKRESLNMLSALFLAYNSPFGEERFKVLKQILRDFSANQKEELYKILVECVTSMEIQPVHEREHAPVGFWENFWVKSRIELKLVFGKNIDFSEQLRLSILQE